MIAGHVLNETEDLADPAPPSNPEKHPQDEDVMLDYVPGCDFVCLQEAFSQGAMPVLRDTLHRAFPYIIYDVGRYSWATNRFALNSGLLFASKHPILAAEFQPFRTPPRGSDAFACKGLLMCKVALPCGPTGKRKIGYICTTHLQAAEGSDPIRSWQMDSIYNWIEAFVGTHHQNSSEEETFRILCGDFNFDNISPKNKIEREHSLFTDYIDIGRQAPGQDHDWAFGSCVLKQYLHDPNCGSPRSLRRSILNPATRTKYLESSVCDKGRPQDDGRRRLDLTLIHKSTHERMTAKTMHYSSAFAGLSDHLPVILTIEHPVGPVSPHSSYV